MDSSTSLAVALSTCSLDEQRHILARGFWLQTERWGSLVVRSARPWCPTPWGNYLLRRMLDQARRFETYFAVPTIRAAVEGRRVVLFQHFLIDATPLRNLDASRLAEPRVQRSLCACWQGVERCWRSEGWLPDIGGQVLKPWQLYRPFMAENVLVDQAGNCWLVDVGASATFHSARTPLGRLHAALMLRAVRRCMARLSCPEAVGG